MVRISASHQSTMIVGSAELLLRTCEEVALVLKNYENFSILFFGFSVFFCSRLNVIFNSSYKTFHIKSNNKHQQKQQRDFQLQRVANKNNYSLLTQCSFETTRRKCLSTVLNLRLALNQALLTLASMRYAIKMARKHPRILKKQR